MCLYDVCVVHSECHPVGSYCGSLTNGQNRWPINDARCVQCHVSLRSLMDVYEWTKGMRHRHALHSPWQLLFPSNFLWYFSFLVFFFIIFHCNLSPFFCFRTPTPNHIRKHLLLFPPSIISKRTKLQNIVYSPETKLFRLWFDFIVTIL